MQGFVVGRLSELRSLRDKEVGVHVETEERDSIFSEVCLVTISDVKDNLNYLVPRDVIMRDLDGFKELFSTLTVTGYYLQNDLAVLKRDLGIEPKEIGYDIWILARLFQMRNDAFKGIVEEVFPKYKGKIPDYEDLFSDEGSGMFKKDFKSYLKDKRVILYYSIRALMPMWVVKMLKKMTSWGDISRLYKLEKRFLKVIIDLRVEGIKFDPKVLDILLKEMVQSRDELYKDFISYVGREVNINSHKDLTKAVFSDLGLEGTPVKTPAGRPSVSKESLSYLMHHQPIRVLMSLRHLDAVYRVAKHIPDHFDKDKKVYPEVLQLAYYGQSEITTRNPDVTSLPWELRESVVPDKDKKFVYAEWEDAEFLMICHLAECAPLLNAYNTGQGLCNMISYKVIKPYRLDTKIESRIGDEQIAQKLIDLIRYGRGIKAVSGELGINQKDVENLIHRFYKEYPEIEDFQESVIRRAVRDGFVFNALGRRNYIPDIKKLREGGTDKKRHSVFRVVLKSSVVDYFKKSVSRIYDYEGVRFVVGVRDSFLLEVSGIMQEADYRDIINQISNFDDISFRFKYAEGNNWRKVKDALPKNN